MRHFVLILVAAAALATAASIESEKWSAIHRAAGEKASAEFAPQQAGRVLRQERRELMGTIPSISFRGSGFNGIYQLGVLAGLLNLGLIDSNTQLNGASSGAQVVGVFCSGADLQQAFTAVASFVGICANPGCIGATDQVVTAGLESVVPNSNSSVQAGCQNTFIAMTPSTGVCNPLQNQFGIAGPPQLKTAFMTRDEIISAMRASSFIPGFSSASSCSVEFRSQEYIDGALISAFPIPCQAGGGFVNTASKDGGPCLVISGTPNALGDIVFGLYGRFPNGTTESDFGNTLDPTSISPYSQEIFDIGILDAAQWARETLMLK